MVYCRRNATKEWVVCPKDHPDAIQFTPTRPINAEHVINVMNFLCWYRQDNPTALWGGVRINEVLQSLQVLLHLNQSAFDSLINVALGNFDDIPLLRDQ